MPIDANLPTNQTPTGLWLSAGRRLARNPAAVCGIIFLAVQVTAAIFADYIAPFSVEETDLLTGAVPPDSVHWLGTDELGRDLFSRMLFGSRISLAVGFVATAISTIIGTLYGSISGYIGGRTDAIMMRILDVLYTIPFIFFVIILMVLFGKNIYLMFLALGAIQWLTMARIVRGQVLGIKNSEYVEAAKSLGIKGSRIIVHHILPNCLGPIIVFSTLTIPSVILEEAFLSFLGLGVQEPMSSWGTLISDGVVAMETYPWMMIFPATNLVVSLLALNFLGDGLRDALDPKAVS